MKTTNTKNIILTTYCLLLFSFFFPFSINASKLEDTSVNYIKKQENGEYCIDLEQAYKNTNEEGKALTGKDTGIDNNKKSNTLAVLLNIHTFLAGNDILCVKDNELANQMKLSKTEGIIGVLESTNKSMMAYFPTVNVVDHLAQTFVPGYEGNNSTLAAENTSIIQKCKVTEEFCATACKAYASTFENLVHPTKKNAIGENGCHIICLKSKCTDTLPNSEDKSLTFSEMIKRYDNYQSQTDVVLYLAMSEEEREEVKTEELATKCNARLEMDSRISNKLEESIKNNGVLKLADNFNKTNGTPLFKENLSGYEYLQGMNLGKIWSEFRNIAYVLYVVILIVIGFMIMFRNKIGGQMMISISNSIPQLIIGLILVTFSFAIVGIALDIGKMLMVVSNNIFSEVNGNDTTYIDSVMNMTDSALQKVNEKAGLEGLLDECKDFVSTTGQTVPGETRGLRKHVWDILLGGVQSATLTTLRQSKIIDSFAISSILKTVLNLAITTFNIPIIVVLIYNIIILLVCAYASFKLFITMFTTYIKIFMNVILAPFQLLAGSMPGNSSALMNWFKSVFANVLVFPAIFIVINFAIYLGDNIKETENFNFFGNSGVIWPSFIANIKGVILVGAYIFCSNLPGVINGFLKVGESKEMASAGESTKKALGKIPLIGGMFG